MRLFFCFLMLVGVALQSRADEIDHDLLFSQLQPLAEAGDAEAQYYLGMMYHLGLGTGLDYAKAYEMFELSERSDHPLSAYKIGCYYAGQGNGTLPYDDAKALKYKLIAADAGYSFAQYDVALIYARLEHRANELLWFERSAAQGYSQSLLLLAAKYSEGIGVEPDPMLAYAYIRLAASLSRKPDSPQVVGMVEGFKQLVTPEDQTLAEEFIANFEMERSELTIKAMSGLRPAVAYVEEMKKAVAMR